CVPMCTSARISVRLSPSPSSIVSTCSRLTGGSSGHTSIPVLTSAVTSIQPVICPPLAVCACPHRRNALSCRPAPKARYRQHHHHPFFPRPSSWFARQSCALSSLCPCCRSSAAPRRPRPQALPTPCPV